MQQRRHRHLKGSVEADETSCPQGSRPLSGTSPCEIFSLSRIPAILHNAFRLCSCSANHGLLILDGICVYMRVLSRA
jgi:hypothetical protein